jgi:hypothetical protein
MTTMTTTSTVRDLFDNTDCTFVSVKGYEETITKIKAFGISFPVENKVTMNGVEYYCIPRLARFNYNSLLALRSDKNTNQETLTSLKRQYMHICSFAFMFGISKDCVRDVNNRLIPTNLDRQHQYTIIQNYDGLYSESLTSDILDNVCSSLTNLMDQCIITYNERIDIIERYDTQLIRDNLIEKPQLNHCCFCDEICSIHRVYCSACVEDGVLEMYADDGPDKNGNMFNRRNANIDHMNERLGE